MSKRDYYDVLGVPRSATADEIRKAHRKLARQFHPDMNKSNPAATEKFKEVQEAYDVLSDAEKRKMYDQFGHAGPHPHGPQGAGDPFEAFRRAGGGRGGSGGWRSPGGQQVNMDDIGSIFEQMFGNAGRGQGPRPGGFGAGFEPESKGDDVEHSVQLTFEQAATGTHLPLRIHGPGGAETIEIKIPPGVHDGAKVRVKGRGQSGPGGAGDLFIVCKVAPHPHFRREPATSLDIHTDVAVPFYDAILGGKVTVPTLEGDISLSVPPGTSSGAKLRVKGKGIAKGAETGDLYAVIRVTVPKDLSEGAKDLVRQLKASVP